MTQQLVAETEYTSVGQFLSSRTEPLTPEEVGSILNFQPSTIRRWARIGFIPSERVNRKIVIPSLKLAEWWDSKVVK